MQQKEEARADQGPTGDVGVPWPTEEARTLQVIPGMPVRPHAYPVARVPAARTPAYNKMPSTTQPFRSPPRTSDSNASKGLSAQSMDENRQASHQPVPARFRFINAHPQEEVMSLPRSWGRTAPPRGAALALSSKPDHVAPSTSTHPAEQHLMGLPPGRWFTAPQGSPAHSTSAHPDHSGVDNSQASFHELSPLPSAASSYEPSPSSSSLSSSLSS